MNEVKTIKKDSLDDMIEEINKLHYKMFLTLKKGALIAFKMGELLFHIKHFRDQSIPWPEFVSSHFSFSIHSARNYMRMHEVFEGREKELIGLTQTDAYILGGIKKILPPEKDKPEIERSECTLEEELAYDIESIFAQRPVSKCKLKNYRIEPMGDKKRLWLFDRNGRSIPVAQLYTTEPQGMPESERKELLRNVQIALENFYSRIEEYEARGIV